MTGLNHADDRRRGIVVVGGMNLDVLATAGSDALSDDSTPGRIQWLAGGVARNIAEALTRLSVACHFHSAIGADAAGDQLVSLCQAAHLPVDRIIRLENQPTPAYVAMNRHNGELLHAVADMSLLDSLGAGELPMLAADIHHSAMCVVDANLPQVLLADIAQRCDQHIPLIAEGVSVSKCQRLTSILPALSLLKVNRNEAAAMAGMEPSLPPDTLAQALLQQGPAGILMTLGRQGVLHATLDKGQLITRHACAPQTSIVSVNGAGDSLLAGFVAARLYGLTIEQQLAWGVEAARLSLQADSACSPQLSLNQLQKTND